MKYETSVGQYLENGMIKDHIEHGIEKIVRYLAGNPEHCREIDGETSEMVGTAEQPHGKQGKKYAFILSGKTECRHRQNVSQAYKTLLDNDFPEENILILDGVGENTCGDCEVFYPYPINGAATKENLEIVFQELSEKVCKNDLLVVYVTDHGARENTLDCSSGECEIVEASCIILTEEKVFESEFAKYLGSVNPGAGVLIFDQCNSGGFAERLGNGNYIAVSACEADEDSHDNTFPREFFKAWKDMEADLNRDGKISVEEAFKRAIKYDPYSRIGSQHPEIRSDINPDNVFLNGGSGNSSI